MVSLAPELPHWEIVFFRLDATGGRRPMMLAAWLLLSVVMASLVTGGLLLARDAAAQRRNPGLRRGQLRRSSFQYPDCAPLHPGYADNDHDQASAWKRA